MIVKNCNIINLDIQGPKIQVEQDNRFVKCSKLPVIHVQIIQFVNYPCIFAGMLDSAARIGSNCRLL